MSWICVSVSAFRRPGGPFGRAPFGPDAFVCRDFEVSVEGPVREAVAAATREGSTWAEEWLDANGVTLGEYIIVVLYSWEMTRGPDSDPGTALAG